MQADAEHQQDDADLGEFVGKAGIGDEARRERPDQHAGDQIADERRHAEAVGERAEDEGQPQTGDDGGDQGRVMRHCLWSAFQKLRCRMRAARSRRLCNMEAGVDARQPAMP